MDMASPLTARWHDRGDFRSYTVSLILLGVCTLALVLWFLKLDPMLMPIWGARSGWYLDTYRTCAGKIWRLMYRATSSPVSAWLPLLWMLSAFLIQSGLTRDKARLFNKVHGAFILAISVFAFLSTFDLMMLPLLSPR